jgi:hypothetical protein
LNINRISGSFRLEFGDASLRLRGFTDFVSPAPPPFHIPKLQTEASMT